MRWLLPALLLLTLTACAPTVTAPPVSTPPATEVRSPVATAFPPPTAKPASPVPPSETPTPITTFPNAESYQWELVASGLDRPLDVQNAGDGSGRLFIVEQSGCIRIVQDGQLLEAPFLDIRDRVDDSGNEQGLLGLAFHPDFKSNGFFYVNYTQRGGDTVIARFTASGNTADPNSEARLLGVKQPFANHNGGGLAFGPDGYLYIGLGDGGSQGDPHGNGQNTNVLLGKLLRIDVDHGSPYAIPPDNPFGNEVWAYGLRNPFRFSFDRQTGDLWIGDVGQDKWEEIDFLPAGTPGGINFGWNRYEGMHDYAPGPHLENYRPPLFEYGHSDPIGGCSVIGGYVYRGTMPEWQGVYFYGDYCTGNVWGALLTVSATEETSITTRLFQMGFQITSFGVDEEGELYIADRGGNILRLSRR